MAASNASTRQPNISLNFPRIPLSSVPAGVEAIYAACLQLYPDQRNPLQVSTKTKVWLGGRDPLDYVSMYTNPGSKGICAPQHWHYVSFGLSDLHGDGRVHEPKSANGLSGFGFELTFRLRRGSVEEMPPTWPCSLMQALARFVFQRGPFREGDTFSLQHSLDGSSESRIREILFAEDAQLKSIETPNGRVQFLQIVGACEAEFKAAQRWNGMGVLELLRRHPSTGGPWLITDLRRMTSVFDIDPGAQDELAEGIRMEGSNMAAVIARCKWRSLDEPSSKLHADDVCPIRAVEICLNYDAAMILPLMVKGRLKHGCHFTFKSVSGTGDITFVTPTVTDAFVTYEHPVACRSNYLQVLVGDDMISRMTRDVEVLECVEAAACPGHSSPDASSKSPLQAVPKRFTWDFLTITISPDQALK